MVPEAKLVQAEGGLVPEGEGWFVVNAREARWERNEAFGRWCRFEGDAQFPHYGINLTWSSPASRTACTTARTSRRTSSCSPASAC